MRYVFRPACQADNTGILALLEGTPQMGAVSLNFERQPDYFRGEKIICNEPDVWLAVDKNNDSHIGGMYSVGSRRLWINGEAQSVRYAHDLRIAPSHRNGTLLARIARHLRSRLVPGEWMHTTVLSDNDASLSTVASGRAGMPTYYPYGTIHTSLLYTRALSVRLPAGLSIRRSTREELPVIGEFLMTHGRKKQFFPAWNPAEQTQSDYCYGLQDDAFLCLWQGEALQGVLGVWDQKTIKQTRVIGYSRALGWLRHFNNGYSRLRGGMQLPKAGGTLSYLSLHSLLVKDDNPDSLEALLRFAINHFHGSYDALVCGFFTDDPLAKVAARFRRRLLCSEHFLMSFDGDPRERLDASRSAYVEVARL